MSEETNQNQQEKVKQLNNVKCRFCGSKNVIKRGFRKTKYQKKQLYKCKECGKTFTPEKIKGRTYPLKYIINAISFYDQGFTLKETRNKLKNKYGIKISKSTIKDWVEEYGDYCPFSRMRKEAKELYSPHQAIESLRMYHRQVYNFLYHKAKTDLALQQPKHYKFEPLQDVLDAVGAECPHFMFKSGARMSQLKPGFNLQEVKFKKKNNYACKLADFALQAVADNYKRHEVLQKFMLFNDSVTIAAEVPVFLEKEDVEHMRKKLNFVIPIDYERDIFEESDYRCPVTGHIDLVQVRNNNIHILDYKPNASSAKPIAQLTFYALALSRLTGLKLYHFKCAWFDQNDYFEFFPLHIVYKKGKGQMNTNQKSMGL